LDVVRARTYIVAVAAGLDTILDIANHHMAVVVVIAAVVIGLMTLGRQQ
jgi:hypothetical protein